MPEAAPFKEVSDNLRVDLREACAVEWARLGAPGVWWTGPKRVAIAQEIRLAERCDTCAGRKGSLTPNIDSKHVATRSLPAVVIDAVHRIVTDPGRLTAKWYQDVRNDGLEEGQFVELVGIVTTVIFIDTFARAIGVSRPALPDPQAGEPRQLTPAGARIHTAWVPTVDPELADGEVQSLYELLKASPFVPNEPEVVGIVPNITRALSLVPPENLGLATFIMAAYIGAIHITDAQQQLIAVTVSSYNNCFY